MRRLPSRLTRGCDVAAGIGVSLLVASVLVTSMARGQTAYPMLMSLRPVAVQVGTTAELTLSARYNLDGAYCVLLSGAGVTGEVLPQETAAEDSAKKATNDKLKLRFTAAENALPGVRDIRVATPRGVSTVGQLVVVRDAVAVESGDNNTPADAQVVSLPAAICGTIEKNEDVDYFKFHAEAGTSLAFLVRCARLEDRIHDLQTHADPMLTLRAASGGTLAASDNNGYYADPALAYRFTESGDYLLEIRDVRYQGNPYWEYCIEVSSRPLAECAYPLAVAAGSDVSIEPLGLLLDSAPAVAWTVPTRVTPGIDWFELPLADGRTNPLPLVVADVPLARETDALNDEPAGAQAIEAPHGINGRIEREGDVDCYALAAKKGEVFSLEVVARRVQSALDAHLRILDAKGKQLALNDDLRLGKRGSADAWIENWTAPADGNYIVEVRDVNLRGGALYPYYLKATRSEPYFELYLDSDKTQIAPGCSGALFVRIERKNGFAGEVQLAIDGLPPGVAAQCGQILGGKGQDGAIVLTAEPDAGLAATNIVVTGTASVTLNDGSTRMLTAVATPYQETYQPGGGRGHWPVKTHTVAVTDPADIRGIQLSSYEITLKPGESQRIEVKIDRSPGFTANVTLDMLMRHLNSVYADTLPPGVKLDDKKAKSLLAGEATEGFLTLTAAKDAPPTERQQAVVVAHVALNFVMKWTYASRPVMISVVKPEP